LAQAPEAPGGAGQRRRLGRGPRLAPPPARAPPMQFVRRHVSIASGHSEASAIERCDNDEIGIDDRKLALWRGMLFLGANCSLMFFLCLGLMLPLVEVSIFPGSGMERTMAKSVLGMIHLELEMGPEYWFGAVVVTIFCIGIPIWLFFGMLLIIFDNFFAMGCDYHEWLPVEAHSMIVSLMYVTCSYQMMSLFCSVLFVSFFTTKTSSVYLSVGFYAWCIYCLGSIVMLQVLDALREAPDEEDELPSLTGYGLRKRFASFFPSLPGFKLITNVDTIQVIFFLMLYALLFVASIHQPLLDVRLVYKHIALQRQVLTLSQVYWQIYSQSIMLFLPFVLFTIVVPFFYGVLMVTAGLLDSLRRYEFCCSPPEEFFDTVMGITAFVRPWVMLDVFAISLGFFLYGAQGHYVMIQIPDGIVQFDPTHIFPIPLLNFGVTADEAAAADFKVHRFQFFSGIYLFMGSGLALMFLRWFWSFADSSLKRRVEDLGSSGRSTARPRLFSSYASVGYDMGGSSPKRRDRGLTEDESDLYAPHGPVITAASWTNKVCRCLGLWLVVCLLMHMVPPTLPQFEVQSMNSVLNVTVPVMNELMSANLPATYGKCVPVDQVPMPCIDTDPLHEEMKGPLKVSIMWMSGLNTVNVSSISIHESNQVQLAWGGAGEWWNHTLGKQLAAQTVIEQYVLTIAGEFQKLSLYLHVEDCAQQPCKVMLDSFDSCCEDHRHFVVKLVAECAVGDNSLSHVRIDDIVLDELVIAAQMDMHKAGGVIRAALPTQDITPDVKKTVKDTLGNYLSKEKFLPWGEDKLDLSMFLNKIIRYNSPHEEFRC